MFHDLDEKHIMVFAAALSYYFVLSVFPLLIFVLAVVAYLPVSNLFNQIVGVLAGVVPPDSMSMVKDSGARSLVAPRRLADLQHLVHYLVGIQRLCSHHRGFECDL